MPTRRRILTGLAGIGLGTIAQSAQALVATPRQTRGPFYPDLLPRESDADLIAYEGGRAVGEAIRITGRVLGRDGRPVRDASVELWQANHWGRYAHSGDGSRAPLDPFFQGYGRVLTDSEGRYAFRTIKPGRYPGRTPHIHFSIAGPGFEPFPTQMYFADEAQNASDVLLSRVRDPAARDGLIVAFKSEGTDEPAGNFDIILAR